MGGELKFGFLPAEVLTDINDLGNWKNRLKAVEQVQQGLLNHSHKAQLLEQLAEFVDFIVQLLHDHNFKVATAGLNILENLASTFGPLLQTHLSALAPSISHKLLDTRDSVTAAAVKTCGSLMSHCLPSSPIPLLSRLLQQHQQENTAHASQQPDLAGFLHVFVLAQLKYPVSKLEMPAALPFLIQSLMVKGSKQEALALESLALATDTLGSGLPPLLRQAGATELTITDILQRTAKLQRPALDPDGIILHSAAFHAAQSVSKSPSCSLGSTDTFSIKAYGGSMGGFQSPSGSEGDCDLSLSRFAALKLQGTDTHGKLGGAGAAESPKAQLLWTAPIGGGSLGRPAAGLHQGQLHQQDWLQNDLQQNEQLLPPGSLNALAAHANLIRNASTMGGAAAGSLNNGPPASMRTGSTPGRYHAVQGSLQQLASSMDSCNSLKDGMSLSSSITALTADAACCPDSLGSSLRASAGGTIAAMTSTSRSRSGLVNPNSRSQEVVVSPELQSAQCFCQSSSHHPGLSSSASTMFAVQRHDSSSSSGRHQQSAAIESQGMGHLLLESAGKSNALGNSTAGCTAADWTDNSKTTSAGSELNSNRLSAVAATGSISTNCGPMNSCWWTDRGEGQPFADSQAVSSPTPSGRSETFSPSRGERLAQLKRRQNEKRVTSASGGTRVDIRDYPPSPDCSPSYATAQSVIVHSFSNQCQAADRSNLNSNYGGSTVGMQQGDVRLQWPQGGIDSACWLQPASIEGSAENNSGSTGAAAAAQSPPPLLKWNLRTTPDGRSLGQQQTHQPPYEQQPLLHLQSAPDFSRPNATGVVGELKHSTSSGATDRHRYALQHGAVSSNDDLAPVLQSGFNAPDPAAEAPAYSSGVNRRSTVSAAAVLTGMCSGTSGSPDRTSNSSSPTIRQRRCGPGAVLGLQQPASASPEYPGASKSLVSSHRLPASSGLTTTAGSPVQLRAQTAAAAVGLNVDWGAGRYGSSCGSPVPGTGSPGSRRGGAFDRPQSVGPESDLATELAPLSDPETSLRQAVAKLQQSNVAARKELDWQGQLEALIDARRLVANHSDVLCTAAHELVLAALPAVEELRSTTARMALLLFQELPPVLGRSLERELDEIVSVLLKKAGELSTAGRDNFLATEADKALSSLWTAISESRALTALMAAGLQHKSPHVRCRAAAHLDEVAAGGLGLEGLVRNNWSLLERVFKAAAALLQEGSLDTRTYGKRLLWAVKTSVRSNRPDMDRLLGVITPDALQRRVIEVVEGLNAPPPPPTSSKPAGLSSRGSSRGHTGPTTPPSSQHSNSNSAVSSPVATTSSFGTTAAASTSPGLAARGINTIGSSSGRARRQLASSGTTRTSGADGFDSKLLVQGAAAAVGGSANGMKRRSRSTSDSMAGGTGGAESTSATSVVPRGPPGPMSPELQEAVEQVGMHLASKDWRSRSDALSALSALLPALPEVPNGPLEKLLNVLVACLSDANARVTVQAMQVLTEVVGTVSARVLLVMPDLAPVLASSLGSADQRVCSAAAVAMDTLVAEVPASVLLQSWAHSLIYCSNIQGKALLVEQLTILTSQVYRQQPQLVVKQLLPAALNLAVEAKAELKQHTARLLGMLADLMGSQTLLTHAAAAGSAVQGKVRSLLAAG